MSLIINTLGDEVSVQWRQNKEFFEIIEYIVKRREEPSVEEIKSERSLALQLGVNMQKRSKQVSAGDITSLEKEMSPILNETNIIQHISEKAASVQKANIRMHKSDEKLGKENYFILNLNEKIESVRKENSREHTLEEKIAVVKNEHDSVSASNEKIASLQNDISIMKPHTFSGDLG